MGGKEVKQIFVFFFYKIIEMTDLHVHIILFFVIFIISFSDVIRKTDV